MIAKDEIKESLYDTLGADDVGASAKIKELPARLASRVHDPLDLPGELIELDTTRPVDLDALAESLRESKN